MRTRIKICCILSPDEVALAVAAGADAVGLVGPMPSGGGILPDTDIQAIAPLVPPGVTSVLLTSRTQAQDIADHVRSCGTGAVQVVNHLGGEAWADLARRLPPAIRRIQVIHIEEPDAFSVAQGAAPHIHGFLLDSGRPTLAVPELGGTGRTHDWALSRSFVAQSLRPVFLAGGLTPDNVGDAIAQVRPFGVDVCSGLRPHETLDPDLLHGFVEAVARADGRITA